MSYIINLVIGFNPDEGAIYIVSNPNTKVILAKPANRLFIELIENAGNIVTRETLLNNVWGSHGFAASNSNLNNYISLLRKSISSLGIEQEIIKTLPKKGFVISSKVVIEKVEDVNKDNEYYLVNNSLEKINFLSKCFRKMLRLFFHGENLQRVKFKKIWLIIICFSLIVVLSLFIFLPKFGMDMKNSKPYYYIGNIENCSIYIYNTMTIKKIDKFLLDVTDSLNNKNIKCNDKKSRVYIYGLSSNEKTIAHKKRVFISQCLRLESEYSCDNFFQVERVKYCRCWTEKVTP